MAELTVIKDDDLKQKIQEHAYEIYEWRCENEVEGCALGDWLDAEFQILQEIKNVKMR